MSLEDLNPDLQSDETDDEAEKHPTDGENEDTGEPDYLDLLVLLEWNLMCFHDIYVNNAILDMEYAAIEAGLSFDHDSIYSELALIQDYIGNVLEDMSSTSSVASQSSSASDDSFLSCLQEFAGLLLDGESSSSGSSVYYDAAESAQEDDFYDAEEEVPDC